MQKEKQKENAEQKYRKLRPFKADAKKIEVVFTQPFLLHKLPVPEVPTIVVDIAQDSRNPESSQEWIDAAGEALVAWLDHHAEGNDLADMKGYRIFEIRPRQEYPSCPRMVADFWGHPDRIYARIEWSTSTRRMNLRKIIAHGDFDGVISAATIMLIEKHLYDFYLPSSYPEDYEGGFKPKHYPEPYPGAFSDADYFDSRDNSIKPTKTGLMIEGALKADMRNDETRHHIIKWLVFENQESYEYVVEKYNEYLEIQNNTETLIKEFSENRERNHVVVDTTADIDIDRTKLMIALQNDGAKFVILEIGFENGDRGFLISTGDRTIDLREIIPESTGAPFRVRCSKPLQEILELLENH